jgi:hypothetical protein
MAPMVVLEVLVVLVLLVLLVFDMVKPSPRMAAQASAQ